MQGYNKCILSILAFFKVFLEILNSEKNNMKIILFSNYLPVRSYDSYMIYTHINFTVKSPHKKKGLMAIGNKIRATFSKNRHVYFLDLV